MISDTSNNSENLNYSGKYMTIGVINNAFSQTRDFESTIKEILKIDQQDMQLLITSTLNNSDKISSLNPSFIEVLFELHQNGSDISFFLQLFLSSSFSDDFYQKLTFDNIQDILIMLDKHISLIQNEINLPEMSTKPENGLCYATSNFKAYTVHERLGRSDIHIKFQNRGILEKNFPFSKIYSIKEDELVNMTKTRLGDYNCRFSPIRQLFFANNVSFNSFFDRSDLFDGFANYFSEIVKLDSIVFVFNKTYKALKEIDILTTTTTSSSYNFLDKIKNCSKSIQPPLLLFAQCLLDKFDVNDGPLQSLSKFINGPNIPDKEDEKTLFLLYICLLEHCGILDKKPGLPLSIEPKDQDTFIYKVHEQFDKDLKSGFGSSMPCQYWTSVLLYSDLPTSMLKRIDKKVFLNCMINHTMINYYDLERLTDKDTLERLRDKNIKFGSEDNTCNTSTQTMLNNISLYDSGTRNVHRRMKKAYEYYNKLSTRAFYSGYFDSCFGKMQSFFSEFLPGFDYNTIFKNTSDNSYETLDVFVKGGEGIQETIYNRVSVDDIIKVCEQAQERYKESFDEFHDFACKNSDYCDEKKELRLDSITENDMAAIRNRLVDSNNTVMYDCLLNIWRRYYTYRYSINETKISTFGNNTSNDCRTLTSNYYLIYISVALFLSI